MVFIIVSFSQLWMTCLSLSSIAVRKREPSDPGQRHCSCLYSFLAKYDQDYTYSSLTNLSLLNSTCSDFFCM